MSSSASCSSCAMESLRFASAIALIFHTSGSSEVGSGDEGTACIRQHTSAYVSICQGHLKSAVATKAQPAYVSIRQHTSAYVRIRQHTSAYVSIRQHTSAYVSIRQQTSAYVPTNTSPSHTTSPPPRAYPSPPSTRQHTSAYVSIRQHTSAYVSIRQHTSAHISTRQHTSAHVSIRQHTSAYAPLTAEASQQPQACQQCWAKTGYCRFRACAAV